MRPREGGECRSPALHSYSLTDATRALSKRRLMVLEAGFLTSWDRALGKEGPGMVPARWSLCRGQSGPPGHQTGADRKYPRCWGEAPQTKLLVPKV